MSTEHILAELRQERAVKIRDRDALQSRIDQLTTAIDALEGRAVKAGPSGSVTDIVEKSVLSFGENEVFDIPAVKRKAIALQPEMQGRITRGIYSAINSMRKHNLIVKCPGGFCRNKPMMLAG